jgi:hypothetical protein
VLSLFNNCFRAAFPALLAAAARRRPLRYERANGYNYNAVKVFMPAGAKQPVMEYLDPDRHPNWKSQLRDGILREETAVAVASNRGSA